MAATGRGGLVAGTRMITVAVAAQMVFTLSGCNLSSPQSNQLNAAARAPTLRTWINLTNLESAGWVALLCVIDESLWPAFGGGLAGVSMWLKYRYALKKGSAEAAAGAPATEDYSFGGGPSWGR